MNTTIVAGAVGLGVLATVTTGATASGAPRSCHADRATVRDVPLRVIPAWTNSDVDAFGKVFTRDASFIVPGQDTYLRSRDEIRAYMARIFAEFPGIRPTATVLDVRCVSRDVGVVVTQGGLLFPGETTVPPERVGRQTWTVVRQRDDWAVTAYHNSRITS